MSQTKAQLIDPVDGTIVNADINASAAIAGSKISPDFGSQNIVTTGETTTSDVFLGDSILHTGDTNTKIRFPAADTVSIETGGSERLRVNSSGNAGIGTASPSQKLEVSGNLKVTAGLTIIDNDQRIQWGTSNVSYIEGNDDSHLAFGVASEKMRLTGTGLGIGTTSPTQRLTVLGGSADSTIAILTGSDTNRGFKISTATENSQSDMLVQLEAHGQHNSAYEGEISLKTGGAHRLRVDKAGKVGIGTSAPDEQLHVAGNIINATSVSGTGDSGIQIANGHRLGFDQSGTRSWSIKATDGVLNIDSGDGGSAPRVRGILFGSDTANANRLDDYEEGTWTPTLSFSSGGSGSTVGNVVCNYTKIGNLVHIKGRFTLQPGSGNGGDLRISGLPFGIINPSGDGNSAGIQVYVEGAATNIANDIVGLPLDNGTTLFVRKSGTTGSGQMGGDVDSGTTLLIGGCYQAA